MIRTPKKQDAANAAINACRDKRHTNWGSEVREGEDRLQQFLEQRLRPQTWCRACASRHCCMEKSQKRYGSKPGTNRVTEDKDQDVTAKLERIRRKRQRMEQFGKHVDNFLTHCEAGLKRQPYLASQWNLPPWFQTILKHGLTIPLVPLFSTSLDDFETVSSGLSSAQLTYPLEYKTAASCVRRLHIEVPPPCSGSKPCLALASLPPFVVIEEVSDGECLQGLNHQTRINAGNKHHTEYSQNPKKQHVGMNNDDIFLELEQLGELAEITAQQLVERCLAWKPYVVCKDSAVTECRDERVLIEGMFELPNTPLTETFNSSGSEADTTDESSISDVSDVSQMELMALTRTASCSSSCLSSCSTDIVKMEGCFSQGIKGTFRCCSNCQSCDGHANAVTSSTNSPKSVPSKSSISSLIGSVSQIESRPLTSACCQTSDRPSSHHSSESQIKTRPLTSACCQTSDRPSSHHSSESQIKTRPLTSACCQTSDRPSSHHSSESQIKTRPLTSACCQTNEVCLTCPTHRLPFKLFVFPGKKTGLESMRVYGTFQRQAGENTKYYLRWKYDIKIHA